MDRGAWQATVDGVAQLDTTKRLSHTYIHNLHTYITMFQAQCKALYLLHCHLMRQVLFPWTPIFQLLFIVCLLWAGHSAMHVQHTPSLLHCDGSERSKYLFGCCSTTQHAGY